MDLRSVFSTLSGSNVLILPDAPKFTIVAVSDEYLETTKRKRQELVGIGLFEAFPNNPEDQHQVSEKTVRASLEYALNHKEPHHLPVQRYDVLRQDGSFEQRYWSASNKPVLSQEGDVVYLIHSAIDVTERHKAEQHEDKIRGIQRAYNLFMNAPVIVGILQGDDYTIELANEGLLEVWGRTEEVVGKPLLQAIPELESQGIIPLLEQVRTTGEPFYTYEFPISLNRHGKEQVLYFDFVYKPLYDSGTDTKATGIISVGHDVTQQVIARQKEQESEAKYRSLFESMDQGFCVLDVIFDNNNKPIDYRFTETNPVFEKQTGLKEAEGKTVLQLVPDLEPHWFELYGKVALTGEAAHFTESSQAMGKWFDVHAFRVGDSNSRKVALLFRNVTEDRKADEAIKQSEANIRNLVMQSPVAMGIAMGPSFIVEVANERLLELWGKSADEIIGKPAFEAIPEAKEQGLEQVVQHVFNTGERFIANEYPVMLVRKGKKENLFLNFVYEPLRDSHGGIAGIMVVAIDVSDQVIARAKIEESQKEFQFVTDFMPQLIWVTKPDGYHYYYNKRWYDYTGLTYGETEGEGWNEVFHPDDRERAWKIWMHSLTTGEPYEIEYRCRRFDGEYRWFLGRALPLKDETGTILKWFGTCTDIHDQKLAADLMEQKVEERTRELKQVNDQLKQFTYAASHDLQEPLRKISYFLDHLLAKLAPTLTEDTIKVAERIQHTTGRMRSLIDDLLAYSNTTLGITGFVPVDIGEIVREVLDDTEVTIIEKDAKVSVQPLPIVKGDQRQLRQLFQNLISNALKYHKKDEAPEVQIFSRLVQGKDIAADLPEIAHEMHFYEIQVQDNGIGFEPGDAQRIFRLFQRLHGKSEYDGTGVGLAIVEKVVENHHGYILAEGSAGKGATFKVLLPAE